MAEEVDRIIGVVLAGHDGRRGYIYHMSVAEDYRKQGIAGKLLENSLSALKAEGINRNHTDRYIIKWSGGYIIEFKDNHDIS